MKFDQKENGECDLIFNDKEIEIIKNKNHLL